MLNYKKQDTEIYYESVPEIKDFEKHRGCVFVGVIQDLQSRVICVENYHSNAPMIHNCKDENELAKTNYYCFVRHHRKRKKPYLELGDVNKLYCIDEWALKNIGRTNCDYGTYPSQYLTSSHFNHQEYVVFLGNLTGLNDCCHYLDSIKNAKIFNKSISEFEAYCQSLQKLSTLDILYQNYSVFDEDLLTLDELSVCKQKYSLAEKNATRKVSCLTKGVAQIIFFSISIEHSKTWYVIREKKNQDMLHGIMICTN